MKDVNNTLIALGLAILLLLACTADSVMPPEPCAEIIPYSEGIDELVENTCNLSGCHDGSSGVGNYNSYQGIRRSLENGQFKQLVLIEKSMPQGNTLSKDEFERFRCWAEGGYPEN